MLLLRTLGELSLKTSDGQVLSSGVRPLLIPAILARSKDHEASRAYVANLIWPESARSRALGSLRQALVDLTKAAGIELIEADDKSIRLRAAMLDVDLWGVDRAAADGRFIDAVSLYRGPFLEPLVRGTDPASRTDRGTSGSFDTVPARPARRARIAAGGGSRVPREVAEGRSPLRSHQLLKGGMVPQSSRKKWR